MSTKANRCQAPSSTSRVAQREMAEVDHHRWKISRDPRRSTDRPIHACSVVVDVSRVPQTGSLHDTHHDGIGPQGKVRLATLQSEVVGIHGENLTCIISSLVGMTIVHVIRDANLRKQARMYTHIVKSFFGDRLERVPQTIPDGMFTYSYRKCRAQVFAPQHAEYVHVPVAIPAPCQLSSPAVRSRD